MDYKIATQNWTIKLQLKIELKANCKSKIKIVATIKLEVEVVIPIKIELKVGANAKQNLKHDIKIRNYFVYTYTKFDFCPQWLSISNSLLYVITTVDEHVPAATAASSMYNFSYVPAERKWLKVRHLVVVTAVVGLHNGD